MTIREILDELAEFSPELFDGCYDDEVCWLADEWLPCLDDEAVFVCSRFPLNMPAFQNAGTLIISEDLLPLVPPFTRNVIIVRIEHLENAERMLAKRLG